jgi:PAS domain S-box-containing protein
MLCQICAAMPIPARAGVGLSASSSGSFQMTTANKGPPDPAAHSANLVRQFLEHAPAAIAMFDKDMRYLAASRRYCADFRIEPRDLIGRSHYDVFPEVPERWKQIHRRCLAGATESAEADEFPRADGTTDWIHWSIEPWRGDDGAIGGIVLYCDVITERVRLQRQLRESERLHKTLLRDMPDLVCRTRPDGTLTYVSDSYCQYFGKTREELIGNSCMPLIPEDDWRTVSDFAQSLGPHNPVGSTTHRVIAPDGQVRWMEWVNRCLFDDDGAVREFQCTGRDVTERKHAENQLRIANLIVEQSPMVLFRWRIAPGWPVAYVSANVHQWGYSAEALMAGRPQYQEVIHPDDLSRVTSEVEQELASGRHHFVQQYRILTASGEARWVEDHTTIERDTDGGGMVMQGIVRDRHARKLIEQRLETQSAGLEATTNAIFIADADGRIEWANSAFLNYAGCSLEQARGQRPDELVPADPQESGFHERIWSAIRDGTTWHGEVIMRDREGGLRTNEMTVTPVRNPDWEVTHFIAVMQDITDRLALERQLQRSQRMESIGLLTGGIAHDFNNLLTVVLGSAEQLQEALGHDERLGQLAATITQGATRGADLTRQLLAFARKQSLKPEVLNVREVLSRMQAMLRRVLGEHINVEFEFADTVWPVYTDAALLESALLNLAINARDAMPNGGQLTLSAHNIELVHEGLRLSAEMELGPCVVLSVTDTGCGIAPEHLDRVFDPFFTTKEVGQGTGLGLPMVYGFVRQSKGDVQIETEPGVGTTVSIYLPKSSEAGEATAPAAMASKSPGGSETILVVEDDEMVRCYAESQLSALGYRVLSARNGPEALEIIRGRHDIDLLFTDIVMPGGMNGRDLADAARAAYPGLKVLYTTGYVDNALLAKVSKDSHAQVLTKPYRRIDLATTIRQALNAG